jgi:hypothetical protein
MDELLRTQIWDRAAGCCEYCLLPHFMDVLPFQIDHIIAIKHHGMTELDILALSCYSDNSSKGSNIAGFDLETRTVVRLFHPRHDLWHEHFCWDGAVLLGLSAIGRVTADVLNINLPERVEHRRFLKEAGLLP